ncbi:autotransporter domain-containing protein [Aureimonas flava]|uniref:autotransporter domain-containing protein n=1 Tax=Aureimonas flava TaxID=2320271 RepID=UPI0010A977F3|nr:autotransporter domain-containing protein [Aureimonas flava]
MPLATAAHAAQLEAALRTASDLALAASARLNARIEAVRDPDTVAMSAVDLDLRLARAQADRTLDPFLGSSEPDMPVLLWDNDFDWRPVPAVELEVNRRTTSDGTGDLWGSGVIELGRDPDGMIASRQSRADVATGFDLPLSARGAAGVAAGFNRAQGGTGTLDLPTVSTYGTFAPTPASFVDLAAGLGPLHASAASAGGAIDAGEAGFATATYGSRFLAGTVVLSPYGRVETAVIRAQPRGVDARSALLASRTSAVAGIRTTRPIVRPDYTLAPALRVEVRQDLARAQSLGRLVSRELTIAPEIETELAPNWTARVEHLSRFGGDGDTRSLQLRLEAKF